MATRNKWFEMGSDNQRAHDALLYAKSIVETLEEKSGDELNGYDLEALKDQGNMLMALVRQLHKEYFA